MAGMVKMSFKRGDTFKRDMSITDPNNDNLPLPITDWEITSQLKFGDKKVADVDVTITDAAAGEFTLSIHYSVTAELEPKSYLCDVEFLIPGDERVSSETFRVVVEKDVTLGAS